MTRFDGPGLVRSVPLLYDCARHELVIVICTAGPESKLLLKTLHHTRVGLRSPFPMLFPIIVGMPHGSSTRASSSTTCDTDLEAQKKALGEAATWTIHSNSWGKRIVTPRNPEEQGRSGETRSIHPQCCLSNALCMAKDGHPLGYQISTPCRTGTQKRRSLDVAR